MRTILLITIVLSVSIFANFTRSGDIVTDTDTGLQWQDNVVVTKTWTQAIDYCENLVLGGYNDWRLPNINEIQSIIDRVKDWPAIDNSFVNDSGAYYWSSTTSLNNKLNALTMSSNLGHVIVSLKSNNAYVRCVRAGE